MEAFSFIVDPQEVDVLDERPARAPLRVARPPYEQPQSSHHGRVATTIEFDLSDDRVEFGKLMRIFGR